MILEFTDGVRIDTSGPLRTVELSDGLYVVGSGNCVPVADVAEAKHIIEVLSE